MTDTIESVDSLRDVAASEWNRLAADSLFVRHEFLCALEQTGCVGPGTGWQPAHLLLRRAGRPAAAMPLYLKHHSFGEYVFDWAWASAFERHGLPYYPKLVSAVPFSPVTGPRLLAGNDADLGALLGGVLQLAEHAGASSFHCLFPPAAQAKALGEAGLLLREGVQFHWENRGYRDFEDFLDALTRDKRRKIRQERRRVGAAGITVERIPGAEAREALWAFFHRCYRTTYRQHGSSPYLNLDFFLQLAQTMPEHLLVVLASRGDEPLAAAFDMLDGGALYGRYWGAVEHVPCLHFEVCYYQAIEHCIEHGLARFEGGAQGEHKLARGLLPERTWSAHWIAHRGFSRAVEDYLRRESRGIAHYLDELREAGPFRAAADTA